MIIKEKKPSIRQFTFFQEKGDEDYGTCMWATFTLDTDSYSLLIESDCGNYTYGWVPTPNAESFVHLMSRVGYEYLLGKMAEKEYFDIDKSIEKTIKNIKDYFGEDDESEIPEYLFQEIRNIRDIYDVYDKSEFYRKCDEVIYRECEELSGDTFEIIDIFTDYTPNAKKIFEVFINYLQPLLITECRKDSV